MFQLPETSTASLEEKLHGLKDLMHHSFPKSLFQPMALTATKTTKGVRHVTPYLGILLDRYQYPLLQLHVLMRK